MVDVATWLSLHFTTAREWTEVTKAFGAVIGFRVIIIFLGMQDRDKIDDNKERPGAWEYVQPVFYLLTMVVLSQTISASYWATRHKDTTESVTRDRYDEWLKVERGDLVKRREANGGKCIRNFLIALGHIFGLSTDVSQKTSIQIIDAKIESYELELSEIKCEQEINFKKMTEEELKDSTKRLEEHLSDQSSLLFSIRCSRVWKAVLMYRYMFMLQVLHCMYTAGMWYLRDPFYRVIWPFEAPMRVSNFGLLVTLYAGSIWIFSFVYGALRSASLSLEDRDQECEDQRICLSQESKSIVKFSLSSARPRPLSCQHYQARLRHSKCSTMAEAVQAAVGGGLGLDSERSLLTSERVKVAGEATTMLLLRKWDALVKQSKIRTKDCSNTKEHLLDFADDLFDETYHNFFGARGAHSEIETAYEESVRQLTVDADHHGHRSATSEVIAEKAFQLTMNKMAYWTIKFASFKAQTAYIYAANCEGSPRQQIGAAIAAAAMCHSYFSRKCALLLPFELKPVAKIHENAAEDAARYASTNLLFDSLT